MYHILQNTVSQLEIFMASKCFPYTLHLQMWNTLFLFICTGVCVCVPGVQGYRCCVQHCVVKPHGPLRSPVPHPQTLSPPAGRPFSSPPPWTWTHTAGVQMLYPKNVNVYGLLSVFIEWLQDIVKAMSEAGYSGIITNILTSSFGLMLYRILSAFSLSWRLSMMASSSLDALF